MEIDQSSILDSKVGPRNDLLNFVATSSNPQDSRLILIGGFVGQPGDAIVILERPKYSEDHFPLDKLVLRFDFKNNQYEQYNADLLSSICVQVIFPASAKDVLKYSKKNAVIITEDEELYTNVTKKYLTSLDRSNEKWIEDILDGRAEQERNIYRDEDPLTGFVLSTSWGSGTTEKDIHLLAMVMRRDLKTLRDLKREHLPLLKKIKAKIEQYLVEKFQADLTKFSLYFHYHPSFYHLHVHAGYAFGGPGADPLSYFKSRPLDEVIDHLERYGDEYYATATLSFVLAEGSPLFDAIEQFRAAKARGEMG